MEEEEKKKIRHTISAEETFTLAKDVFDIRTFIKNVYSNRAVIARRINLITLTVSLIFTVLYSAFMVFTGLHNRLSFEGSIVIYSLLGVYVAMAVVLLIIFICGKNAKANNIKKISTALKFFRLIVRLLSIAISIAAIVLTTGDEGSPAHNAVQILVIVFSLISLIIQVVPLLFGGTGKFIRWLLSPVKVKRRFSAVVLEWYELAVSGKAEQGAAKKVSKKYFDEIGALIDKTLIPQLGKKYINTIKPTALSALVDSFPEEDRPLLEGVLKNVFAYATECGYVTFDPCRDLNLEGSIEEEEKKKVTIKDRLMNVGKKIGKKVLDNYIAASSDDEDK